MALIASGHLSTADELSKTVHVITTTEVPGQSSSSVASSSGSVLSEPVRVVQLPKGPAAEHPFVGTSIGDSKTEQDPGVRVQLKANKGMTVFAGSCVFLELHYERQLDNGSFVDVCAH